MSPAMRDAMACIRRGELVPDTTVWELVRERSRCIIHCGGFILDGFPRTVSQAESLKKLLEGENLALTAVVNYELPLDEIVARLSGRRTCEKCMSVYHVSERPPKTEGLCDHCGGHLFQREDDRPESIAVRMKTYEQSTAPLIQFYKLLGLLLPVAAKGAPEEIADQTIQHLNRLKQSQLTTSH